MEFSFWIWMCNQSYIEYRWKKIRNEWLFWIILSVYRTALRPNTKDNGDDGDDGCYDPDVSMKNMTKHLSSSDIYIISFNCFYLIQLHDISMFIFKSDCINHVEINMLNRLCVFIRLLFLHLYKTIILLLCVDRL